MVRINVGLIGSLTIHAIIGLHRHALLEKDASEKDAEGESREM